MLPVIRYILRYAILVVFLIWILPCRSGAVQWEALTSTSRHQVALDSGSVRLTPLGRLAVWLRFTPLGSAQRKAAATEYGEKGYRFHHEYYEIDCSEQSALLGLIDIFGTGKARLKRLNGGSGPDSIIPGSVLDRAAQKTCPVLEDESDDKEPEEQNPAVGGDNEPVADKLPNAETLQIIQDLLKRIAAEPFNHEAWSLLGNAYYDADLPEEAIIAYSRALAIKPDDTDILNDQGAMYRLKGEFQKALANFERALKSDPYNLESLYNIGYVYAFDLNSIPKAVETWKRYMELDKGSETARQVQSFLDRYQKAKN